MDKKLFIENINLSKETSKLGFIVRDLQKFLNENEKKFKEEKSIEAIDKIKLYLETKEQEYNDSNLKRKKLRHELSKNCNHEIAIKKGHVNLYECLVCNRTLTFNEKEMPSESLISIDATKDYEAVGIILNTFKDVVYSDKDLVETISNTVEELQYEKNIKVHRRQK